ncbi:alpha-D-ribose 1-methylphosphonate 5-triphosphate diphosphatase [Ruania alba]|uniref:Alpha-D-ribose 1-methylphosphonate 5-triphosphate diphosphatase n=1 Tax=Ruania alba TaxID=648782 RepID=A0A1H5LZ72_9MICO|nr:alpha-D-ribose 1-methylphosphonate 5-triphosphate diphosphatase [Ruania alba]SEE82359.1 alpha-D-ribose 1-methylphosphonate 5-triphosphate diphosphatase [Ruania alba]
MSTTISAVRQGWRFGTTPADYVISDVHVVLPGRVTDRAAVAVENGLIAEVVESAKIRGDVDGGGLLLAPGLIDVHSDALEKERTPRPSAELPWDYAMASFEGKVVAAGITTVFHGAGFHNKVSDGVARRPSLALELCDVVDAFTSTRVDHRVLHRFNVRSDQGAELIGTRIADLSPGTGPILLSHEDHTPGQGQYADVGHFIDTLVESGEDRAEVERRVQERMEQAARTEHVREANLTWAGELASSGRARLLGHDPDTAEAIDQLLARGGAVAEFPTTLAAARRARECGLLTVAGAPNVLRGSSHSGNVSAAELITAGLVDALASDYLPSGLLGSLAVLRRDLGVEPPEAFRLLTAGPAAVAGLSDRGRIEPGLRADLVLVDLDRQWPTAVSTFSATGVRA